MRVKRWLRFVVGGVINTGFTYLIYLGMNAFLSYQMAYLIAYITGIIFSYWFNARVVFHVPLSWKGFISYPLVYAVQYVCAALFLGGLVEFFNMSEIVAPLVVSIAMIPLTYLVSKFILRRRVTENTAEAQRGGLHE